MEAGFRGSKQCLSHLITLGTPLQYPPIQPLSGFSPTLALLLASHRIQTRSETRTKGDETVRGTQKFLSGSLGTNKNKKKINADSFSNH